MSSETIAVFGPDLAVVKPRRWCNFKKIMSEGRVGSLQSFSFKELFKGQLGL